MNSNLNYVNNPSLWRNNDLEISCRSFEEESLKRVALERLPTYDRLKKGLLTTPQGESKEIDINELGFEEKKNLINRLVEFPEKDNEQFLLKLKKRFDRVGIEIPTLEVRYEHLNIEAEAYVGSRGLPTIFNFFKNILEGFLICLRLSSTGKKRFAILNDVSGIIKPCRMTLLLGPPGSGKTTLLLALAGNLDPHLKFSGRVTYNGHEMKEIVSQRTAAYVSQQDIHNPEMTVRETLSFSARCQGVGGRYEMLAELLRREKAANIQPDPDLDIFMKAASLRDQEINVVTDYILKVLGLENCADIMVGDELIRGISAGQKKRLTTGEMLVGPAKVLLMDEISTGLDSSTTFQVVNSLKQVTHILKGTVFISLLQPAPETYDLFDDIVLLSDGQIVYQGPCEHVLEFFESLGFKCPERKGVADFLQEVISKKDQKQYWARMDQPYSYVTVEKFAEAFQSFHVGQKLRDELATEFDKSKSHPALLTSKKYGVSKRELFKACWSRELLLMKRLSFIYIFKLFQLIVMAVISSTLFIRTKMPRNSVIDGGIYMGALFFSVVMLILNGLMEIGITSFKLPVFYKQRNLLFFPGWAYALPTWILKIPITFIEALVWTIITYYLIGFDPNVERYFRQFLALLLIGQLASVIFRLIAVVSSSLTVANTLASFILLVLFANSGFVLSRENIKTWWIWGYWFSPAMYAQNALAVNEFLGNNWSHALPFSTEPLGFTVLKSYGFFTEAFWYWIGIAALMGQTLLLNLAYTLALTYFNTSSELRALSIEDYQKNGIDETRTAIELSSQCSLDQQLKTEHQDEKRTSFSSCRSLSVRNMDPARAASNNKKGMILPFEQHFVVFDDITYSVDMPQEMKNQGIVEDKLVLLRNVSGYFRPGVLTALMGVTGAGKTTLMDVLAGRKTSGYIEGSISISGYPKKQETFARICGYCEQNDIHSPYVTVYESLLYSAWLRLPAEINSENRKIFVEEVMELIELNSLREAIVGVPGINGLSAEQRKRLTIAVELVANPSVIFMDEPTSGLDARAAAIVMRTVRNTVDTGRTVVCTIHQPSIDVFESFDELLLLKLGGQVIFAGSLGHHSCDLINYFEGIKGVSKIKDRYNPATWVLEITTSAQEIFLGVDFSEIYKNSELHRRNRALVGELSNPAPGSKDLHFPTKYPQPFFTQLMACLWKQHWSYWRNTSYTAVRFLFTILIALMFGTMFWEFGTKTETKQDVINAMGSMYGAVIFLGIQNSMGVIPVVATERTVFYREKAAGMYSALACSFAQVAIEIPYIFIQAVTYGIIVYAMIGFEWSSVKFFWYIFYTYFSLLYYTFHGMMLVAITPNYHLASMLALAFYGTWNLFSGYIVPQTRIPIWWRWYYWACPAAWTSYGLVTSQYGDNKNILDVGFTVDELLRSFLGFRYDFLGVVAAANVGFTVLFAFLFAISLILFNFQRR